MGSISNQFVSNRNGAPLISRVFLHVVMLVHASLRFKPQRCVKGHWEHGKTPVEMDLLSHKYSPATFHPAGEKLPNGHLCNLSLQNLNIGEQETLIHAFLRIKAYMRIARPWRFDVQRPKAALGGPPMSETLA